MSSTLPQAFSCHNLGTPAQTAPQTTEVIYRESAPLWAMRLECKKPHIFTGVPYQSLSSWSFAPLMCIRPSLEVTFPHSFDPLGRIPGWLEHYSFPVPSPIVHICDDNFHIGVIDLSHMFGITDEVGVLKFIDIICFLGFFMGSDLSRDVYLLLDEVVRSYVSLGFRRRIAGPYAQANSHSKDWNAFMNNGKAIHRPRNSDLFLERRNVWKFSVWPNYSILWVTGEFLFGPEI